MTEKGIGYLRFKLSVHKQRAEMRYEQYAMKYVDRFKGITIPQALSQQYRSILGWCAKGVDSLADRLVFREFENDDFTVNEIFEENNPEYFLIVLSCQRLLHHVALFIFLKVKMMQYDFKLLKRSMQQESLTQLLDY
ncbi:hypothetical protein ICE98_03304 [Lactococcus lactis]|nr:hypothetical protein [Lactococcus lactis]